MLMIRRLAYIESRKTLADAGTIVTDINVRDPITALWFEMRATNGGTSNKGNFVADCVNRFEIIDGGAVLVSLTGYELAGLYWQLIGKMPYNLVSAVPSVVQNLSVPVMFGRWLGDTQFAFDPSRFRNPQLRISWNLANVRAVGATGFLSGSAALTIVADVMEGVGTPSALLTAKQVYSFTTAASGVEVVELPVDGEIKALMVRAHEPGVAINSSITNVKLNVEQQKFVPFDMRMTDFVRYNSMTKPPIQYKHELYNANGDTIYVIPKQDEVVVIDPESTDSVAAYANNGYGSGALSLFTGGSADTNNRNLMAYVHGWLPFGGALFEHGDAWTPEDWFPAQQFKSVKLELTQGNAGADASVVVQQVMRY
jgi:hypothetical protein